MNISIKNKNDIEKLRSAGQLAANVLNMITEHVKPGISTGELDDICHDLLLMSKKQFLLILVITAMKKHHA